MKNTYDEQIECLQHLKAGGKLEWYDYDKNWSVATRELPSFDCHKYRPLVEKYQPEVGERVIAGTISTGRAGTIYFHGHEFRGMIDGKYVCKTNDVYAVADIVKPIEQPKPVAREWWVDVDNSGSVLGVSDCDDVGMIKVREVLE